MSRMRILLGGVVAAMAIAGAAKLAAAGGARPPNVVLIISDDQSWTDYGFMGHKEIRTPSLDRLASQSAVFSRGYVPTSLCRPSLASIISGLYPHQHRITGNDPAPPKRRKGKRLRRDPDYLAECEKLIQHIEKVPTLPRLLATKGYLSLQTGKWWEGHYSRGGFTHGMTHGDPARGGRHGDAGLRVGRREMKVITDFIDNAGDTPFFIWYAPFLPHTPHNPPERILKRYRSPERPNRLAKYYAMCEWFDETCGQLLDHLEMRGVSENTLVVFVTDNGWIQRTAKMQLPERWNQSFAPRSKQSPNEGGVRTPILLRWPGRIQPGRHDHLASSIDLAPTILAACGLPKDRRMSGLNLLDVCAGKPVKRTSVFGEIFAHDIADRRNPGKSLLYRWCIHDRWKLIITENGTLGRYAQIHRRRNRSPQLYDVVADPHETKNLAEQFPERVNRLRAELDDWWSPSS